MNRIKLLRFHRWLSLALGVLILLQGCTGVILVFRDEIEGILHPQLIVSKSQSKVSYQSLANVAHAVRPNAILRRLTFSEASNRAVIARMDDSDGGEYNIAIDPYRGTVLHRGGLPAWPTKMLLHVHEELYAGEIGSILIGLQAGGLVIIIMLGILLWWPGRRRIASGYRVIRNSGADRFVRSLHRVFGASAGLILIVSAFTGFVLVFRDDIKPVVSAVFPVTTKPNPKIKSENAQLIPLDALVYAAKDRDVVGRLRELRFLGAQGQVLAVYFEDIRSIRIECCHPVLFQQVQWPPAGLVCPILVLTWDTVL